MRRWLIGALIVCLILISGCVHVRYNPVTDELTYLRVGEQKIGRLEIEANGVRVTLTDQKASADELIKAMDELDPVALRAILVSLGIL